MRGEHDALEQTAPFSRLMTAAVTQADYLLFLKVMYGFYRGCEERLQRCIASGAFDPDYPYLARLPLLAADLGDDGSSLHHAPSLSLPLSNGANVAGVLYVVEGSRHGARQIGVHLAERLGKPVSDFAFLSTLARQSDAESGWNQLLQHLEGYLAMPEARDEVLGAARATFSGLRMIAASAT